MKYLLNDGISEKAICQSDVVAKEITDNAEAVREVAKMEFMNSSYSDVTQPAPDSEDSRFGWLK